MNADSHKSSLFNESGCLSQEALRRYAASMLLEDELKLVEAHISSCPLCKDAAEGISMFNEDLAVMDEVSDKKADTSLIMEAGSDMLYDTLTLHEQTDRINKKLRQRFRYSPGKKRAAAQDPGLRNFIIPAAASIIILLSIISYFHFLFPDSNELAQLDEKEVVIPDQEKAATVGGVFNREAEEKGVPVPSQAAEKDEPTPEEVIVSVPEEDIAEQEEITMVEEDIMLTELDEEIAVVEAKEMADETVTAYTMEELAGAGDKNEDGNMVSRAKSGKKAAAETREMIVVYDQNASFPGGKDSLYSFLDTYMKYAVVSREVADTGLLVQFIVSKRGIVRDFNFIQGAGVEVNDEVLRVLKAMPDWIPALKEGKNTSELVNLPIYLKIY